MKLPAIMIKTTLFLGTGYIWLNKRKRKNGGGTLSHASSPLKEKEEMELDLELKTTVFKNGKIPDNRRMCLTSTNNERYISGHTTQETSMSIKGGDMCKIYLPVSSTSKLYIWTP